MKIINTGIFAGSLFLVASCGSSSSGNSNTTCNAQNPTNKMGMIFIPGSNAPANNNPAIPAPQDAGNLPAGTNPTNNCDTTPGNLGDDPTTANNPAANPGFPGGNFPGTGNVPGTAPGTGTTPPGGARGPALDISGALGTWDFEAVYCENGTIPPVLQRLNEMRRNDEFYVTLTINRTSMEEFRWVKLEDQATRQSMMCTIKQNSTFTANGPSSLRVSTSAASYDDAGGEVKCSLGSEPSAVYEKVGLFAGGDALVRTIGNAPECSGMTMIQSFSKRP
ncbi:MAG: hypothetical protein ACO3A4_07170 [Silvanigrellaceae bacterium]